MDLKSLMGSIGHLAVKDKVVFVLGATGTGKSKLAIALATHFNGEIINSDKIQVYDGLDVITNKVTAKELATVRHHLISGVHPDADYTPTDFCTDANRAIESILQKGKIPIIAGGSNRYIEELVEGESGEFKEKYDCCFLWVDVEMEVLHEFVAERVDSMVEQGLVEEARRMFDPNGDYTKGVRRSIGVPEMDRYFRAEVAGEEEERVRVLGVAIQEIKDNTCSLTCRQRDKIQRLRTVAGWDLKRIDATELFRRGREEEREEVWEKLVAQQARVIVEEFLLSGENEPPEVLAGLQ